MSRKRNNTKQTKYKSLVPALGVEFGGAGECVHLCDSC
jgi:hypothetical protein